MNGVNSYGRRTDLPWLLAILVTLLLGVFVIWLIVRSPDDTGSLTQVAPATTEAPAAPATLAPTTVATAAATTTTPTIAPTTSTVASEVATTVVEATTTTTTIEAITTSVPEVSPSTSLLFTQDVTVDPTSGLTYPTWADGRPVPIMLVFDDNTIRLSGSIPSEDTRPWIIDIAKSNVPEEDPTIFDELIVNEDLPIRTGVRVVETDSSRFAFGSSEVTAELSAEYDRFIPVLNQLEYLDVLIIGHSDEQGNAAADFALSADRARAVSDYIVAQGVAPDRVTWRGASLEDQLSDGDGDVKRALARRTEIVYYGLLIRDQPPE